MSETEKKLGVNYLGSDFEKLAHVLQHGLWGLIVKTKKLKGESTKANDLSCVL